MTECTGHGEHLIRYTAPDGTDYIALHALETDTFALLPCVDYTVWLDMDGASLKRAGSMLSMSDTANGPFDIFNASGSFIGHAHTTAQGFTIIHETLHARQGG